MSETKLPLQDALEIRRGDEELIEKTRDAHKLCESAHDECESLELARRLERIKLNKGDM